MIYIHLAPWTARFSYSNCGALNTHEHFARKQMMKSLLQTGEDVFCFHLSCPPPSEKATGVKSCKLCHLKEQRIQQIQNWWTKANNFQVPTATLIIFPLLQTFLCLCLFNNCQTLILNCKHFDRASSPSLFYSSSHINIATN